MKQPAPSTIVRLDARIIHALRRLHKPLSRLALFVVFFWFGALKVFAESPANPLVQELLLKTLPGVPFQSFIIFLGCFEMVLGILFLIRGLERLAIVVLLAHMLTTVIPLFVLPHLTWGGFLMPTLEGQYIIKNIVIIALGIGIAAELHPLPRSS